MNADEELKMTYSGVIRRNGRNAVCVRFERPGAYAEGYIPECVFERSEGFSEEEMGMLRAYLREHEAEIRTEARKLNNIKAWFGGNR